MRSSNSKAWNTPGRYLPSFLLPLLLVSHHSGVGVRAVNFGVEKVPAMTMPEIGEMQQKELGIRQEASPAPTGATSNVDATNGSPDPTASASKPDASASVESGASTAGANSLYCNKGLYICPNSVGGGCCPLGISCRPSDCFGVLTTGIGALPTSSNNILIVNPTGPITVSRDAPLFTTVPSKKKLSGGAIGGIAAGAVVGIVLLGALLFFACKKWKRREKFSPYPKPDPSKHHYYPSHTVNAPSGAPHRVGDGAAGEAAKVRPSLAAPGGTHRSHSSQQSGHYSPSSSLAGYYYSDHKRHPSHTRSGSEMSQRNYGQTPSFYGGGKSPGDSTYPYSQFGRSPSNNESVPLANNAVSPSNNASPAIVPGSPASMSSGSVSLSHVRTLSLDQRDYNPPVASWPTGYNPPVARSPVFEVEGCTPLAPVPQSPQSPKSPDDEQTRREN